MSPPNTKEGLKCDLVCHQVQKWICSPDSYPHCTAQWVMKCQAPINTAAVKEKEKS